MMNRKERRAVVMEQDFFALQAIHGLFLQDCRVDACTTTESPDELLAAVVNPALRINLVVISTRYEPHRPDLLTLLRQVKAYLSGAIIVCLSAAPDVDLVHAAVVGGAHAFFVKADLALGLVTGVLRARPGAFLYSPRAQETLRAVAESRRMELVRTPAWRPNRLLARKPGVLKVFERHVLHGLPASSVKRSLNIESDTVYQYTRQAYQELSDLNSEVETTDFLEVDLRKLSKDEVARLLYCGLPPE